jgi:hypothetical protein
MLTHCRSRPLKHLLVVLAIVNPLLSCQLLGASVTLRRLAKSGQLDVAVAMGTAVSVLLAQMTRGSLQHEVVLLLV